MRIIYTKMNIGDNIKKNREENTDLRIAKIANKIKELRIKKGYKSYETFAWENELNRVQYWRMKKAQTLH